MHVRPLRESKNEEYKYGAWVYGEDDCVMPDGKPVFKDYLNDEWELYKRECHVDFIKWCEERGWYCFQYDAPFTFFVIPISEHEAEVKEWNLQMDSIKTDEEKAIDNSPNVHCISEAKGYCPF
jgi:hypothetical protein